MSGKPTNQDLAACNAGVPILRVARRCKSVGHNHSERKTRKLVGLIFFGHVSVLGRPSHVRLPRSNNASSVLVCLAAVIGTCPTSIAKKVKPCTLESLPSELQARLKTDYSSWRIQELPNLSVKAKARWQSERALECPGVAVGEFKTSQVSYAVLLVPIEKPDAAYRLVIFTLSGGAAPGSLEIADQWDNGGAANYFIRPVRIAKAFGGEWVRKLKIGARDGVMSVEAAENEYGVDVYYWANGQFRHEPIDQ